MKPSLRKYALAALVVAPALLVACGGSEPTQELDCELEITPSVVGFGAICLDAEKEGVFSVRNSGSSMCNVDLALDGEASKHFELSTTRFNVPVGGTVEVKATYRPTGEGGASASQNHGATVIITSNAKEPTLSVKLQGETAANEAKPILSLSCPPSVKRCGVAGTDESEPCCRSIDQAGKNESPYYGRTYLSSVRFGDVETGGATTLPLQVTNLGCGELEVSDLVFDARTEAGFCDPASVTIVTELPISVPGSVSVQERQSKTIELQFAPTDLCSYGAGVTVQTNDSDIKPNDDVTAPFGTFNLSGAGVASRIRAYPDSAVFGDIATGSTKTMDFAVENTGSLEAQISSVSFRSPASGVFQIVKIAQPDCPPGGSSEELAAPFSLAGADLDANCGPDQFNLTVAFTPNDAGEFSDRIDIDYGDGVTTIRLSGSSRPKIEVVPYDTWEGAVVRFSGPIKLGCDTQVCSDSCPGTCIDDEDCGEGAKCIGDVCEAYGACTAACGVGERELHIYNAGHAPLKFEDNGIVITGIGGRDDPAPTHPISGLNDTMRDGKPKFSVGPNSCVNSSGKGGTVPPGGHCVVPISYLDSRNGGEARADLRLYTNDYRYPRDTVGGYVVSLHAATDVDMNPVASIKAYDPDGGEPQRGRMVELDATDSYDPACVATEPGCDPPRYNPIASYSWELVSVTGSGDILGMVGKIILDDPNASCPLTVNGGNCFEVIETNPPGGKIRFFADKDYERTYSFKLTVGDGVCSPEHIGTVTEGITVKKIIP